MALNLDSKKVFVCILAFIFLLVIANLLGIFSSYYNYPFFKILFNFDSETNMPSFFSVVGLIFSAVLFFLISFEKKSRNEKYLYWHGLAFIFLFLALDEMIGIHEEFTVTMRELFGTSGFLYYAWILPYGAFLVLFFAVYARFLFQLPKYTRLLMISSGVLYVSGAVGFEMLGGMLASINSTDKILYKYIYTGEEFLEMLGVALLIYTLLHYIAHQFKSISIHFK